MESKRPHPTTIRLPPQTQALLDAVQAKLGIPASQVIIRAIEAYAAKEGIKL
jgi:predicted DNA-binding protein